MSYTLSGERHELDAIFQPRNVAVVGASDRDGHFGRTALWNLMSNPFGGTVYPVNPSRRSILGIQAYPSIKDVPAKIDLAVIITPANTVPKIMQECVDEGVQGAIIISAGFREVGEAGKALEREICNIAYGKMRFMGPNALGVMFPRTGLNATVASSNVLPGNVAFLSQSAAVCGAVRDWSLEENVGFSAFMSIGSMLDIGWSELLYYFGEDPQTHSIVIFMENIGDASSFMSAAREVSRTKPIIVLKGGRTQQGALAASSHTGMITEHDNVLDAAFRRTGVLRVDNLSHLFYMAELLAKQPRPTGRSLVIVTNAGGPGILATDALTTGAGKLAKLDETVIKQLDDILPEGWSRNNPIDILGDADAKRYQTTLEVLVENKVGDGVLVMLAPQAYTQAEKTAEVLKDYARLRGKPVLAAWMGGRDVSAGRAVLNQANLPTFSYPDTAARMFNYMWRYVYNLRALYETPVLPDDTFGDTPERDTVSQIISDALNSQREVLTEIESKQILAAYGIPVVGGHVTTTVDEAVQFAEQLGYPVALKLHSQTITHKASVGGVELYVHSEYAVRNAFERIRSKVCDKVGEEHFNGVSVQPMILDGGYELIVGSSIDAQFGPVLLFGMGGNMVEIIKDRALGLPPITTTLARRMMEQTHIYEALSEGYHGQALDLDAIEKLLVRFSQIVIEQPRIKEIDINPLLVSPERVIGLDARIILHPASVPDSDLPKPAIRPYPVQYVDIWTSRNGTPVAIRPIRAEDEPLLVDFHNTLSEQTVYQRYMSVMKLGQRTSHERLSRMSFIDYDREMALVALLPADAEVQEIIGVGRIIKLHGNLEAEFSLVLSDEYQRYGLGTELLSRLIDIGREEKLERIVGYVLPDNQGMLRVCERLGFKRKFDFDENIMHVVLDLNEKHD